MNELKPCPWEHKSDRSLGKFHAVYIVGNDNYQESDPRYVECSCGAQGPTGYSVESAIAAWNTRASDGKDAALEALRTIDNLVQASHFDWERRWKIGEIARNAIAALDKLEEKK